MTKSEQINELAAALAKAQAEIRGALKDSANPFFKSSYADLSSVWDAIRAPLSKNGLAVTQTTDTAEKGVVVETMLLHSSGQWLMGALNMPLSKQDAQGVGSAITYARRYALAAMVGVAQVDDDAESAVGRSVEPKAEKGMVPPGNGIQKDTPIIKGGVADPRLVGKHYEDADPRLLSAKIEEYLEKYQNKPMPGGAQEFVQNARPYVDRFNKTAGT